ncbi:LysR family transcriptional regulator [Arhodomonas sp. AD133]|uniref:LysR family transcriptional regulator n=1 Tax=Arhodomonas sp. AD133 TaxID=3415009 RepID=UPI003EB98705
MNLRGVDLNLLAVFDAILQEGSITRAAERLDMSQPATSNALNRLRALLHDPLFVRQARGMTPTPRARQLAEPIREALTLIRHTLSEQWLFDYAHSEHRFRVAMSDYGDSVILPRLLDHLARVAPAVQVDVVANDQPAVATDLRSGDLDLAIGNRPELEREFRSEGLLVEQFICMARADHPGIRDRLTLRRFAELHHVDVSHTRYLSRRIDEALAAEQLRRRVTATVPSFLSVAPIVAATDLITTIPWRAARAFAGTGGLRLIPPPVPLDDAPVHQYWHASTDTDPASQWLRRTILTLCQRL